MLNSTELKTKVGIMTIGSKITFNNLTFESAYRGTVISLNTINNSCEVACDDWADCLGDNIMTAFADNVTEIN